VAVEQWGDVGHVFGGKRGCRAAGNPTCNEAKKMNLLSNRPSLAIGYWLFPNRPARTFSGSLLPSLYADLRYSFRIELANR